MNILAHIKASEKGVSIMEIVATVCLIGILLKVAIPSFSAITQAQNKRAGRESFETFLKRAQATAIKNGANEVVVLPYFLSAGRHVITDVPADVESVKQQYPEVKITIAPYLGSSPKLVDILFELAG
jgi:sirohydrochlorin ferrochelatase